MSSDQPDRPVKKPDIYQVNPLPPLPPSSTLFDRLIYALGIGLGSGKPERAPGTWGTVGGLIVAIPLLSLGWNVFLAITLCASLVGSFICGHTSKLMQVHDDPHIVFDEWVGMWITLLPLLWLWQQPHFAPLQHWVSSTLLFASAFLLFRFFDILKPFPIDWIDRHAHGGFGILIDDVLAGLMSAGILYGLVRYFYPLAF